MFVDKHVQESVKGSCPLYIISWHSETGARLNSNTTDTGDDSVLLPPSDDVTPLTANVRHATGIVYAYVKVDLNFNALVKPAYQH